MKYHIPRIMLAAPSSGCGKTMMTCGLLKALWDRGCALSAFKCGPDYIDPMFHKYVLGVNGGNLDSFFLDEQAVRRLLVEGAGQGKRELTGGGKQNMTIIEGVMGYFDGVAGTSAWASSYDIARITETPVILIVDGKGASLSVAAVVQGFLQYERDRGLEALQQKKEGIPGGQIKGVLLNQVSPVMAERLKPEIERLGVTVVGCVPEQTELRLESRHLGLVRPEELDQLQEQLEKLSGQLEKTVNIDRICQMADEAPDLVVEEMEIYACTKIGAGTNINEGAKINRDTKIDANEKIDAVTQIKDRRPLRIGVARDRAFCFYYQENLRLLEYMGAELVMFSPLSDNCLPKDLDGLILGGGYPELYAWELSSNTPMRNAVKSAIDNGMPYLAECGGFLYLHQELEASDGSFHPMVGAIQARGYRTEKLSRFGYITLTSGREDLCLKQEIRGHEFHYWDSTDCGEDWNASKPNSNRGWGCVHSRGYQIAGFPHLYYPSNPEFVRRWLDGCRSYRATRREHRE